MSWWEYVQRVSGEITQAAIAERMGMSQSAVGRWQSSTPKPEAVRAFAHAFDRPVVEAFVAAGFLTEEEAELREVPADLARVDTEYLLEELRRRTRC
ncbi:helix-turn-helix domain-containing protein [Streptosporangium saharense]|uniref:helix-turn-helix domain-containing protein n=1 Tax=Streptosporangium saharense TaxID=1706840 RepID=UPI0034434353